ncbi:MAG: 2,3-diketo-5-methylthio-1-phosphopentane phosphatase [Desulfovibrio sp. MES5]|uniref:HAD-IB family phosphatase n=1 Tax=Desulfovibrio sp. MES5 TaxID=1899016 RepID=UPI000B9D0D5D|nr:HAD-IB family phosphatase [Desulfovibrio sp. MES5]OXS29169.1 MAG: 2,3-diketo-5-methylthio-1-phosphopentane phosphatase [Desulfovibrio sp. MES5]
MPKPRILVTDFDGTITTQDFYKLVVDSLLTHRDIAPWQEYRDGKITHLAALQQIFAKIRAPESELNSLALAMQPDPRLSSAVASLRNAGWEIVVASAGCDWYIQRVLASAGVSLPVHANHAIYEPNGSLRMLPPTDSPFYCAETGVDKAGIVRSYVRRGYTVAFAGDGFADLPAALAVSPDLRFARADLAATLGRYHEDFHAFSVWSDVADALLAMDSRGDTL